MNKSQLVYLRRIVGMSITMKGGGNFLFMVNSLRAAATPEYQLMKDIACDARFYSVVGYEDFWKDYCVDQISEFINSLSPEEKDDEATRTDRKEDFLNEWLARHLFPLSESDIKKYSKASPETDEEEVDSDEFYFDAMENYTPPRYSQSDESEARASGFNPDDFPSEDLQNYAKAAKRSLGGGSSEEGHTADAQFLNRIHPSIRRLALKIGRGSGTISYEPKGRFQAASRSDISGVTSGNDLNSLLPSELALLGLPQTENIFYQRFAQKRLQIFSSASRSPEPKDDTSGPIYICIDTSGSMNGEPEVIAKTLALAIAIVAQRDKRPVCLINYSHNVSFFVLTSLTAQRQKLLHFLSHSYSGGNNENALFDFIFHALPRHPKYQPFSGKFENADMLVISDFEWMSLAPQIISQIESAKTAGMRIFSLNVNEEPALDYLTEYELPDSGPKFINSSTEAYTYDSSTGSITRE